jgi:hypothetical protein
MRSVCLTLPTNRACAATIVAMIDEAAYAVRQFDVVVHLVILDSADAEVSAGHAAAIDAAPAIPNVTVWHLDETRQRDFLRRVVDVAGVARPDLVLELMLPARLSYGACTNRAFLIAVALGCESVHRRDSDSRYQESNGVTVFPIHHELLSLGRVAADAVGAVSETDLDAEPMTRPVVLVGGSFVGELSVDVGEIQQVDPEVYYDFVSLWAPQDWSDSAKRKLVDEAFRGAGAEPFTADHSVLTLVDPMHVDMCNVSFFGIHEQVPLPPATDTIGSDYFLLALAYDGQLPGVLHNRNIVNFYTPERRTDAGFEDYQLRLAKYFLLMLHLHFVYQKMRQAGDSLLDEHGHVRASMVRDFVRESTEVDQSESVRRLDGIDRAYRMLGGRYAAFADVLVPLRARLLTEARQDMVHFALLIESWASLVGASRGTPVEPGRSAKP